MPPSQRGGETLTFPEKVGLLMTSRTLTPKCSEKEMLGDSALGVASSLAQTLGTGLGGDCGGNSNFISINTKMTLGEGWISAVCSEVRPCVFTPDNLLLKKNGLHPGWCGSVD